MPDLTRHDFQSATWQKLRALYETRLSDLRTKNDNDLGAEATAALRGQIRECKHFLALEDEPRDNLAGGLGPSL